MADSIKFIEHFSGFATARSPCSGSNRLSAGSCILRSGVEADSEGRQALRRWRGHIEACACDLAKPAGDCRMHRLIAACSYYIAVLDTDWYRMMPWHSGPPPNLEMVDPARLYRDVGIG